MSSGARPGDDFVEHLALVVEVIGVELDPVHGGRTGVCAGDARARRGRRSGGRRVPPTHHWPAAAPPPTRFAPPAQEQHGSRHAAQSAGLVTDGRRGPHGGRDSLTTILPTRRPRRGPSVPTSFGVLGQDTAAVLGRRCAPRRAAAGELVRVDEQVQRPGGHVEHDLVAVADQRDRAAFGRLGRDVPDAQPRRRPGEAAVGHQQHVLAQPGALDRPGDGEHLPHPRGRRAGPRSGSRRRRRPAACRPRRRPSPRPRRRTPGPGPANRARVEPALLTTAPSGRASRAGS